MKYVIYIDVFFCVNLIMDFVILKLASLYIKPQTTYLRCLLGSAAGSFFSIISLMFPFNNMIGQMLFSYIFIVIIMVMITFGIMKIEYIVRNCLVIYVMTIFLGGLMNFLYSYTYLGYIFQSVIKDIIITPNIIWLLSMTAVSYLCINGIVHYLKREKKCNLYVKVHLLFNGKYTELLGLIDTGNSLREPYSGKPVHIVSVQSIKELLDEADLYSANLKYVPFHSIGEKHGLIKTLEFNEMLVYAIDKESEDKKELIYKGEKVIVGLYEGVLSEKSEYQMILHKSINFEGGLA